MNFFVSISVLVLGTNIHLASGQGDALVQPTTRDSSGGVLDTTLSLEYGNISGPHYTLTNARLFDGTFPGPTLRLNPGDTLRILFDNQLEEQDSAVQSGDNVYHKPDHSNLHFHGGHVSGELPSDDVRYSVGPGESYQYETVFPDNHMPGTHWIHPHLHGSTTLQVGSGASMAMIVQDPDNYLPTQVEDATDVLLFVQSIIRGTMNNVITDIQDSKLSISITGGGDNDFRTVNGQYQPVVSMSPGEWQRWRVVYAGYTVDQLDFQFENAPNCEMKLLAKDGIYIQDYPRDVTVLPMPAGGRADVMVRCTSTGDFNVIDYDGDTILTASVSGATISSTDLEAWSPTLPAYLTDLTSTSAGTGCDCTTNIAGCGDGQFCLNDNLFDVDVYMHTVAFGSVVERELRGFRRHPYHQHVYPFQLVSGVDALSDDDEDTYFQTGDWHDVFQADQSPVTVRYRADVHTGVIMLHCHILTHEDEGAMSQELVIDGGDCECDALYTAESPTATPGSTTSAPATASATTPSPTPLCRGTNMLQKLFRSVLP